VQEKEYLQRHQPGNDQVLVHNLNFDKLEVHPKTAFLASAPFEVPCQGLFSALLHYNTIAKEVGDAISGGMTLAKFQLVHLKNIKGHSDAQDSLDQPLITSSIPDEIAFKRAVTTVQGGKGFGSATSAVA
jgi:hypothetical protein